LPSRTEEGERLRISVVIASYNSAKTIGACLDALQPQLRDDVEVIVSDSSTDGTPALLRERFPWVRLLRSETRMSPGASRNAAVAAARGDILAFLDADCIPRRDWIEQVIKSQRLYGPVVGGSVENANPAERWGWTYYFCEFAHWMPGQKAGPKVEVPTCNLTVQRSVLERAGPFRSHGYCSDTAFHWRLKALGIATLFAPDLQVAHINPGAFGRILRKMAMHGEHFARMRSEETRPTLTRLVVWWLGCPALPFLLLLRRTRQVRRARRYGSEYVRSLAGIFAALCAWSLGEWKGYGHSLRQAASRRWSARVAAAAEE
jgi:GT2 family glycosyltransferase